MTRDPFAVVLGITQDGGYPQAGCTRACCEAAWNEPKARRHASCLGIVDPDSSKRWIIDATPDFREQLRALDAIHAASPPPGLDGILLTHGHIGHYIGLVALGREVLDAREVPVHVMPRMAALLKTNAPWEQLVRLRNILLRPLAHGRATALSERISVTPLLVPHRDEYTETVGFVIRGPRGAIAYAPDTDKWDAWPAPVEATLAGVDAALLDGTFFSETEIPGRDMAAIPHPFVTESLRRFAPLSATERAKIRFTHLNHTNPLLREGSRAQAAVLASGCRIAEELSRIPL